MVAKRYNKGKLRYDLLPVDPLKELVKVYTNGAHKYTVYMDEQGNKVSGKDITLEQSVGLSVVEDGADNWKKGLSWKGCMASVQRHIESWRAGEDVDEELGTLHLANAAWGLFALIEYNKTHGELDDRITYNIPRIGVDIDNVLADFSGYYLEYLKENFGAPNLPRHWNDPRYTGYWDVINTEEFWGNIPPLIKGDDMPFEPVVYVTARSINPEWTQKWLDKWGFPTAPVIHVPRGTTKVEALKDIKLDIFVDDSYSNFVELNNAGIHTKLFTASHNLKNKVPHHMRITSLNELI